MIDFVQKGNGPFALKPVDPDNWKLDWYINSDTRDPTPKEMEFATKIDLLATRVERFKSSEKLENIRDDILKLFSATLVAEFNLGPNSVESQLDEIRDSFFRDVVGPEFRQASSRPIFLYIAFAIGIFALTLVSGALVNLLPKDVLPMDTMTVGSLLIFVTGTFVGRTFFMGVNYVNPISSMETYHALKRSTESRWTALTLDAVFAFVVWLIFHQGFIILALGGTKGPESSNTVAALSTLDIGTNAWISLTFGVGVGIARSGFTQRITTFFEQLTRRKGERLPSE